MSLPEVSTSVVQQGTINTSIRGRGLVTANDTYEVKLKLTRTVDTVMVKKNDIVEEGQVLFTLKGESVDLKQKEEQLQQAQDAYRKAVLANTSDKKKTEYERLVDQLTELKNQREQTVIELTANSGEGLPTLADATIALADATRAVTEATSTVEEIQRNVDDMLHELSVDFPPEDGYSDGKYVKPVDPDTTRSVKDIKTRIEELEKQVTSLQAIYDASLARIELIYEANGTPTQSTLDASDAAYVALKEAKDELKEIQQLLVKKEYYVSKIGPYENLFEDYTAEQQALWTAKRTLSEATAVQTTAKTVYDGVSKTLKEIDVQIKAQEQKIEDFELANEDELTALELEIQRRNIDSLQKELDELKAEGEISEVTAPVAGIVKSIMVNRGDDTIVNEPLVTIELPERGYYLTFNVTSTQAQDLRPGMTATAVNRWGPTLTFTLANIRNAPEDTSNATKQLLFNVSGDSVSDEVGSSVELEIGAPAGQYDRVVPNSALGSDNQGDFVLLLERKETPLGTRYIATRIDVTVLAKDDTNVAVSGGLLSWDYVIKSSDKSIEPGQYVRLANQ
ncbi:MAG: HlyD family efflux transporter periplasmic adaptor subunit [Oscillospiraceae bacterium]|nr:HlyD family efflux transporter periplasmic adaptor subunit [Oscillospiraceae bacterium]